MLVMAHKAATKIVIPHSMASIGYVFLKRMHVAMFQGFRSRSRRRSAGTPFAAHMAQNPALMMTIVLLMARPWAGD